MKDTRRTILKNLLMGHVSAAEALSLLQDEVTGPKIIIVVQHPDSTYSIGPENGLSEDQVKEKTKGKIHIIVSPAVAKLGSVID